MYRDFAERMRCVACRGDVVLSTANGEGERVREGEIVCRECNARYPIERGVPFMLTPENLAHVRERVSAAGESKFGSYTTEATPAVAKLVEKLARSARVVLDIGSGRAPYLEVLRGDVICVDLYPHFLFGLQELDADGVRVHPVCADATNLPFQEGVADVVLASEVIEHLVPAAAQRALAEWPRYARAWCVIDTPNGHEDALITRVRHAIYRTKTLKDVQHEDVPELDHHSTFGVEDFRRAGYDVHGSIGWVSRERFRLGPLWDLYDAVAWRFPTVGGTLIAVSRGRAEGPA